MIDKVTYIESPDTSPYQNLAVEEYLLLHSSCQECILYLWQNQHTVVIGRNQNAWKECLVTKLEEEGGHLARRLSGGGAVYHDLGNLNFTFLVRKENYDVARQTQVILRAVQKLGIHAERSGRNDILVDGKKFSGHAYYEQGDYCYHHGTLMVNVDMAKLSRYLTVSKEKLQSKGVDSVRARVANLTEFVPGLTIGRMKESMLEAFEEVYGLPAKRLTVSDLDSQEIEEKRQRFASWDWLYGKKMDFQYEIGHKFSWGQVTIQWNVRNGWIEEAAVFSDAMNPELIRRIPGLLRGIRYTKSAICAELERCQSADLTESTMIQELIDWINSTDL